MWFEICGNNKDRIRFMLFKTLQQSSGSCAARKIPPACDIVIINNDYSEFWRLNKTLHVSGRMVEFT